MSSDITYRDSFIFVSNRQLFDIISLAIEFAKEITSDPAEQSMIITLKEWYDTESFPGVSFDLEERFPSIEQKKFWSRCFNELGVCIFRRGVEEASVSSDRSYANLIGNVYVMARLLIRSVQEIEHAWHPEIMADSERRELAGKLNIRV